MFFPVDLQANAARLHGGQMRSPCNKADVRSGACELRPHVAADRAGAVDANLLIVVVSLMRLSFLIYNILDSVLDIEERKCKEKNEGLIRDVGAWREV